MQKLNGDKMSVQQVETFAESHDLRRDVWVEKNILPKLQRLLDEAQARLNRGIKFLSGNGTYGFYFFPSGREQYWSDQLDFHFTNAVSQSPESGEPLSYTRYRARFPGLVEFVNIVVALGDELEYVVDDVIPTNFVDFSLDKT
jgi:hypothetical protein